MHCRSSLLVFMLLTIPQPTTQTQQDLIQCEPSLPSTVEVSLLSSSPVEYWHKRERNISVRDNGVALSLSATPTQFELVNGFEDDTVSIKVKDGDSYLYLRHENFYMYLDEYADTELFRNDSSWKFLKSHGDDHLVVVQSFNYPDYSIKKHGDGSYGIILGLDLKWVLSVPCLSLPSPAPLTPIPEPTLLPTPPCNRVEETQLIVKHGDATLSGVEVVEGMSGWQVNGKTTTLHEIPEVLLREGMSGYFVSDQSSGKLTDGSPSFSVWCPENCEEVSCEVVVVVYHCPPCSTNTNGGFLQSLPSNGWQPGSCSPKFQINNNNNGRHRMTSFYKRIPAGTQETIEVSSPLQHTAIFGRVNAVDCGKKTTQQTCVDSVNCKWDENNDDGKKCIPSWCTTSKGPQQQPSGTCEPCVV